MKKLLEVLVDEKGDMHLSTDFVFHDSVENPPLDMKEEARQIDIMNRQMIRGLVKAMWGEKNIHVSKAIRLLHIGEIMACAQPYENAEEFWYTMMFSVIPHYEKFASDLKKPYGYNPKQIVRPVGGVFPFNLSNSGKPKN